MTRKTRFIKPPNRLKEKVGDGGIPPYVIKQCQTMLETNPVEFGPFARRLLADLQSMRPLLQDVQGRDDQLMEKVVDIVMQFKSNGSMFRYQLISMVSDVMLKFAEKVSVINRDFVDILAVYTKVIEIILEKRLSGTGGREGYILTQELHNACLRYTAKYKLSS